ncbi:MAG: hypothetical protein FJ144_12000 [Deltaproteobacteria bacterium]|nr:hypothetical protein [Deltaproteobacteria bacterium]
MRSSSSPPPEAEAGSPEAGPNRGRRAPRRRRGPLGRILVLVVLCLAVFLALGEVLTRTFDLVDRLNGFPRRLYAATDDEDLPYLLRPGVDTIARGVHVTINEHGMRGPPLEPAPPGTARILVLGDSVAFGYRLEWDATLTQRLAAELEQRTGEPHQVLNGGVEGYNTENQLAWLRRFGLPLDPDAIVVALNLNDYDYGPVMGPLGVLTLDRSQRVKADSIGNQSELYLLLRWLALVGPQMLFGDAAPVETSKSGFNKFDEYVSVLRKRYYLEPNDERWPAMIESLRGLRDEAKARGIPLLVAILPDGDQVGVPKPDLTPQERLAEVCAQESLDCFDLLPAFRAEAGSGPLFLDIMHPNARGHAIVGRALSEPLARALQETERSGTPPPRSSRSPDPAASPR